MTDNELKKEQHEKLRALIAPLASAIDVEPADTEDELEEAIWEAVSDLYTLLTEFFKEGGC